MESETTISEQQLQYFTDYCSSPSTQSQTAYKITHLKNCENHTVCLVTNNDDDWLGHSWLIWLATESAFADHRVRYKLDLLT